MTFKVTMISKWTILIFHGILEYLLKTMYSCTSLFFMCLVIFNQNIFPSLLHLISSLMMWLAWGRSNMSLTWDRPIANYNQFQVDKSLAPHFFLFQKLNIYDKKKSVMILVFFSYTLPPSSGHTLLYPFTHTFPFIILFSHHFLSSPTLPLSLIRLSISRLSFHLFFVRLLPAIYLFASCFSSVYWPVL